MKEPRTTDQMQFRVIAKRQAPGDRWMLVDENHKPYGEIIEGLVETLSTYMRNTGHKDGYRLEPLKGILMAIEWQEAKPAKTFDLYGEF